MKKYQINPGGCRYCGVPKHEHCQIWHGPDLGTGGFVQPTQEQIKERMVTRRSRSHLNVMREALRLMEMRQRQLITQTHHPERSLWFYMAQEWQSKIWHYESYNRITKKHPTLGYKLLLPGKTSYYYMSNSIIRMLRPYEKEENARTKNNSN